MKYIIFTALFLIGCSETTEVQRLVNKECVAVSDKKELASFVLKCAEAANPKSDEEGEDLVIQCERTGRNVICPSIEVCRTVVKTGMSGIINAGDWGACE